MRLSLGRKITNSYFLFKIYIENYFPPPKTFQWIKFVGFVTVKIIAALTF